jgi:hypothetical protein
VRAPAALAVAGGLIFAPTSSAKEVGAAGPSIALAVTPAHVALAAPGSRTIRLRNLGTGQVAVDVGRLPLGPRRPANRWVRVVPPRFVLRPGWSAPMTIRVTPRPHAAPGDHHVLVLLVARPVPAARVAVRMRLGVVLRIRVPGRIVRSVELRGLRVLRQGGARILLASVANRGNVSEELRGRISIVLSRRGHVIARLHPAARSELRPGTRVVFRARYSGRVRGFVKARVAVRVGPAQRLLQREYAIRL